MLQEKKMEQKKVTISLSIVKYWAEYETKNYLNALKYNLLENDMYGSNIVQNLRSADGKTKLFECESQLYH